MGPAVNDLVAGHIETMFAAVGTVLPLIKEGKVRAIALTGGTRLTGLLDIPVIAETLPSFNHREWFGVLAPPRTPRATINVLSQAISDALRSANVEDRLRRSLLVPMGSLPEETAEFLESERQRWRAVVDARSNLVMPLKP